jgi:hypothetical protein
MKTDRRHALQTNWLADHLGHWLDKVKPYTNYIITGVFVLAAGLAIWGLVAHFTKEDQDGTWQLLTAQTTRLNQRIEEETKADTTRLQNKREELQKLLRSAPASDDPDRKEHDKQVSDLRQDIKNLEEAQQKKIAEIVEKAHEDLYRTAKTKIHTVAGCAAAFSVASKDFSEAASSLMLPARSQRNLLSPHSTDTDRLDPVEVRNRLDRAIELFKLVAENTKDKLLKQRAQFQLARAYETRLERGQEASKDDVALARVEYEKLAKQVPPSYCKDEAQRRLEFLDSHAKVYEWVHDWAEKQLEESKTPAAAKTTEGPAVDGSKLFGGSSSDVD